MNRCRDNTRGGSLPDGLCNESGWLGDDDESVFESDIEWMAGEGITKGCNPPTNDRFCPEGKVTRGRWLRSWFVRSATPTTVAVTCSSMTMTVSSKQTSTGWERLG